MKINYLLYSVAFASAFAACSDELTEVANAPVNEAVAGRPSAGNVALSINNGTQTRLNATGTGFTDGDQVKLFLMDEFNLCANGVGGNDAVASEEWNANLTPFWSQDRWFKMYNMVDYVQTNYIYDYDPTSGNFYNNAAQLVEGNYIAYYQENQDYRWHEITNRQDLWAYINPVMKLDQKADNVYANMENDIYLDYQQFYRLEEAGPEGKLVKEMKMKPVLNRVKFTIGNLNNAPYRIKRIVIKQVNQQAVPTLAYIRPYAPGFNEWNNDVMNDNLETSFSEIQEAINAEDDPILKSVKQAEFDNKFTKHEVYDDFAANTAVFYTYNGGKNAFTQADARDITYFETPANGRIPFGLKKGLEAPAFEYTLEFPDGGHILNAQAPYTSTERVDVFAALPVFADQLNVPDGNVDDFGTDYMIIVEGDYLDITKGEPSTPGYDKDGNPMWVPGFWQNNLFNITGISNTNWKMEQAFEYDWTEDLGKNWPTGTLTLDYHDMYLYEEGINTTAVTVSSTEQLLEAVKASATYGDRVANIELNGIGIELTQEIADLIAANAAAYKIAHPLPAAQYEVNFTVSALYAVSGAQFDNTTTDLAYNNNGAADSELDPMGHFNFNTVLVVTAKDVFALPTNIQTVSATYVADQTANKEITFGTKTIFAPGATLTVNKKVKAASDVKIVFTNNTTIVLNNTLENAYIIPSATVEVKGTGTIKGNNLGRVSLPAQNIKKLNEDGVTYTELGFNDVLTHSDLVNATSAVKLFKAENRKASIVDSTATYNGNDTTEDYELVSTAENVTVAKNIKLFTD